MIAPLEVSLHRNSGVNHQPLLRYMRHSLAPAGSSSQTSSGTGDVMKRMTQHFLAGACALLATTLLSAAEPYPGGQGWSASAMRDWYEVSQGSQMMPLDWFNALTRADGARFADKETMAGYGFLFFPGGDSNYPVGFVEDDTGGRAHIGLNCAACHTSKLSVGDATVFVHGGQTLSDFQRFTEDMIAAVDAVAADEAALKAFGRAVSGVEPDAAALSALKAEIAVWLDRRHSIHDTANGSDWGIGRSDAVGIILATVGKVVEKPIGPDEERMPFPESDAPVSYPFAWNANQQARLQHNGVVDNGTDYGIVKVAKIGALIRNWTEAFGVFASSSLSADGLALESTIRLDGLLRIEQALSALQSPRWPDAFGAIDKERAARGEVLYRDNCLRCHGLLAPEDTLSVLPLVEAPGTAKTPGFVYLQPLFAANAQPEDFETSIHPDPDTIGTDPTMACNAMMHVVPAGRLQGTLNQQQARAAATDQPFGETAVTTDLLRVLIQRDVTTHKARNAAWFAENQLAALGEVLLSWAFAPFEDDYIGQATPDDPLLTLRTRMQNCVAAMSMARALKPASPVPSYKARPLNGIWATAPFLHNGSVPTLDDLLKPQAERPASFGILDGEMDVEKLGLRDRSGEPGAWMFNVRGEDGIVKAGNWNGGHEYGTALSAEQRRDLIEYVRGL